VLGAFTFTMDSLPGSPQIQNVIPSNFLGTSIYSGPYLGVFVSICMIACGVTWLNWRIRKLQGEGYGNYTLNEQPLIDTPLPAWQIAILPLLVVLVVNYIGSNLWTWNPEILAPFTAMKLPLAAASIKSVVGPWSLIIAVSCGIATACAIGWRGMSHGGFKSAISLGAGGALLAIMTVASEVGYGNVVAALPGFKTIASSMLALHIGDNPLASMAVTINAICGITGSASGGVSIALDLFGKHWLEWAANVHMAPEILHRFAAIASGGFDTGPHNGAIITLLAVCGLTHRESYPDIFAMTLFKVLMVVIAFAFVSILGFA
jgi:H+/gluconate symporter-like permease